MTNGCLQRWFCKSEIWKAFMLKGCANEDFCSLKGWGRRAFLNAAISSLLKAQEHLATLFAGLNQGWGLSSALPEKSSAHCTNKFTVMAGSKWKLSHIFDFLGKITGALSMPSAALLMLTLQIHPGRDLCQDVFWRGLSPEHLVPFFGNPKSCCERSTWMNDTPTSFLWRIRLAIFLFY